MILLYSGSFDPVTYGHINIIRRAAEIADKLIVGVGVNKAKTPMFTVEERMTMLERAISGWTHKHNIEVISIDGLTVDAALKHKAVLVRGIRNTADMEQEMQIDTVNKKLGIKPVETIYLFGELGHISSSLVKDLAKLNTLRCNDLCAFVPPFVADAIWKKLKDRNNPAVPTITEYSANQAYQDYLKKVAEETGMTITCSTTVHP